MKKLYLVLLVIFIITGISLVFTAFNRQNANVPTISHSIAPTQPIADTPYEVTLEGEIVCLVHKDTSGPQTRECAIGLKADDGEYYALNIAPEVGYAPETGKRIRAIGTVTPAEMLSTDQWHKYNMKGIFTVKTSIDTL